MNRVFCCVVLSLACCGPRAFAAGDSMPFPGMPEAVSSFGAVTAGDYVYIFGGHMGRVPGQSLDVLSPHFSRLKLSAPGEGWQDLPMLESSQSPGLVAWEGKVYRVGGLSFRNKSGEPTAFRSLDLFAKFDPEAKAWKTLAALPAPRSSLDAAVVDGKLYVVGGWNLQEGTANSAPWHDEALAFDLSKDDGQWTAIAKPPFQTRALAAAAHDHKLYVLGGMMSNNKTTRDVHIYDPKTNGWSKGPELPSGGAQFGGFAIAACDVGGKLCYSGGNGAVFVLSQDGTEWRSVERQLFPRMFHRAVPVSDNTVALLGGVANGGGYLANVEVIRLDPPASGSNADEIKKIAWSVEFPGAARRAQVLLLDGSSFYAFGGNSSDHVHDYAKETFVRKAFRFDLAGRTVEKLPDLPQPTQSGAAFLSGARNDQSIYVLGGLGSKDDGYQSIDLIQQYRLRGKAWSEEMNERLPASRAMFDVATRDGAVWIFGGSAVKTVDAGLAQATWTWKPSDEKPVAVAEGAALPTPRRSFGSTVLEGRYYAVGGLGKGNVVVPTVDVYNFVSGQWSQIAGPKRPRVFGSLAAAGGKLYLSGGFSRQGEHLQPEPTIERYDPAADAWQVVLADLAPQVSRMTLLECQDRLLFYGLDAEKAGLAHFVLVDPTPHAAGYNAQPTPTNTGAGSDLVHRLMRLDKNEDGKLTNEEVGARFQPILAAADENKDGFVTREELAAYVRRQERTGDAGGPGGSRRGGPAND